MSITPQQLLDMQSRIERSRYVELAPKKAEPAIKRSENNYCYKCKFFNSEDVNGNGYCAENDSATSIKNSCISFKLKQGRKNREENTKLIIQDKLKQNTNKLTSSCITLLNLNGYKVWRNNNNAVYDEKNKVFRKPTKDLIKGVPDIIGYQKKSGLFIGVEIKANKDRMSPEQIAFHQDCDKDKAVYLVIRSIDELEEYLIKKS